MGRHHDPLGTACLGAVEVLARAACWAGLVVAGVLVALAYLALGCLLFRPSTCERLSLGRYLPEVFRASFGILPADQPSSFSE